MIYVTLLIPAGISDKGYGTSLMKHMGFQIEDHANRMAVEVLK